MHLLLFDLTRVPAATEGFHQIDRTDHSLAEQLRLQPFTGEQCGLRSDDVEVTGDPTDIAIVGDRQRAARIFDGRALRGESLGERAQIADAIFDLPERREHRLAVVGYGLVIASARSGQIGAVSSALEQGLQGVGTEGPEEAGGVEQRPKVAALPSSGTA